MSYQYEVKVAGKWYSNSVVFATEEEAKKAGSEKFRSWTTCDDFKIVESDKVPNYRWDVEKGMIHIASED